MKDLDVAEPRQGAEEGREGRQREAEFGSPGPCTLQSKDDPVGGMAAPRGEEGCCREAAEGGGPGEVRPGVDSPERSGSENEQWVSTPEEEFDPGIDSEEPAEPEGEPFPYPPAQPRTRIRKLVKPEEMARARLTPQQRLLLLDTWQRSGLPAGDFSVLVGLSKHSLYEWKKRFEKDGPEGFLSQPREKATSRVPEVTRRTILMLKQTHPDWGCQRISDVLFRSPGLGASPSTVGRVLHEQGYQLEEVPTKPHPDKVRSFERARPNELWQTDLFTFVLKRQNRRVHLVGFLDDHSRFMVSYGLHATASAALVIECLRAGIASWGAPEEVLTDNGTQYVTWRGKSGFAKELERRGIRHIVAAPRRPQTLGKIERFWGTLWRECVGTAIFLDLSDAQKRIGHFIDYYNFQRPHNGLDGATPAERFFQMAPEVRKTLSEQVAANALSLARNGIPKQPFYLTGRVGEKTFSVHAEGERVILTREGESRQEVDLSPPATPASMPGPMCPQGQMDCVEEQSEPCAPGVSALDRDMGWAMGTRKKEGEP